MIKIEEQAKKIQIQNEKIEKHSKKMQFLLDEITVTYEQREIIKESIGSVTTSMNSRFQDFQSQSLLKFSEHNRRIDSVFAASYCVFTDTYIWRVNNLSKKMEKAKDSCSKDIPLDRSFYTSRGHKLKIELFLNGYADTWNKNVSMYFQTQNGVFDDVVKWPMRASINSCVLFNGNAVFIDSIDTTDSGVACSFQNPMHNSDDGSLGIEILHDDQVLQKNSITFKIDVGYF